MLTNHDDGTVTVTFWVHPGTEKIHHREDCRATRRIIIDEEPQSLTFPNLTGARLWFRDIADFSDLEDGPEPCRWCFPPDPSRSVEDD